MDTTNELPSLDGLERNTLYTFDANKPERNDSENYVFKMISFLLPKKCKIQYRYSTDGNTPTCPNALCIITYLNDCSDNAFVITDIDKDAQKYKSFGNKCSLFISSVNTKNVVYYLSEHFHKMIGNDKSESFDICVSFEDDCDIQFATEFKLMKYKNNVKSIVLNKSLQMDYAFFNDLIYDGKLSFDYKEFVKPNGFFGIFEHSDDYEFINQDLEGVRQLANEELKFNRFYNRNTIL
jgi:hypothetical protein